MNKEWKCKDCVCFSTDDCHYPSQLAEYKACKHLVVDHNYAYQQGKADALLQTEDLIRQFTKEWNKESAKRVSRVAMDELISFFASAFEGEEGCVTEIALTANMKTA